MKKKIYSELFYAEHSLVKQNDFYILSAFLNN